MAERKVFAGAVSPNYQNLPNLVESDSEDESRSLGALDDEEEEDDEVVTEMVGEVCERIGLPREDEFVRKLRDPKLPTQEEVDSHWLMGHCQYRDWCDVCVRAQGKEMGHQKDPGNERGLPEYSFDYCFLEMNSVLNGRFW